MDLENMGAAVVIMQLFLYNRVIGLFRVFRNKLAFGGAIVDFWENNIDAIIVPLCHLGKFTKSIFVNSVRFRNGSKKIGLWVPPPPLMTK